MLIFVDAVYAATELTHATLLWSPNPELSDSKGSNLYCYYQPQGIA